MRSQCNWNLADWILAPMAGKVAGEIVDADMQLEANWIRHHHERIDGAGYPDGLAGDDIPLESRMILVADAFEAMTSDRPYRMAPGQSYAIDELRRHSGTQFDPTIVDALIRCLDNTGGSTDQRGTLTGTTWSAQ